MVAYDLGGCFSSRRGGCVASLLGHAAGHQQLREIEVAKVRRWRQGFQHPNDLVRNETCHVSGSRMRIGTALPISSSYHLLLPPEERRSRRASGPLRILSSHCHPTQSLFPTVHVCGRLLGVRNPSESLFSCLLSNEVLTRLPSASLYP